MQRPVHQVERDREYHICMLAAEAVCCVHITDLHSVQLQC